MSNAVFPHFQRIEKKSEENYVKFGTMTGGSFSFLSLLPLSFCAVLCRGSYLPNDETFSIERMSTNASAPNDIEQAIISLMYQPEIFALNKCSCVSALSSEGSPLSRFYIFDTAGEVASGLQHQLSNLRAVLGEGLGLGRVILLREPSLSIEHNYLRAFKYRRWSDFLSFEDSSFEMSTRKQRCSGALSDCVAEVSDEQLRALLTVPHVSISYRNGTVSRALNKKPGLLVRGPILARPGESSRVDDRDRVGLVRRLPGLGGFLSSHRLKLVTRAPRSIRDSVAPVVRWLDSNTKTRKTAVVHVRRGDKIRNAKYCPKEMIRATSPEHIANVLGRAGIPAGSAIYVMTDEADRNHFAPLVRDFGYVVSTHADFPTLRRLRAGCEDGHSLRPPRILGDSSSSSSSSESGDAPFLGNQHPQHLDSSSLCENYLLFAIEKEIMAAVPASDRIVTIARRGDNAHNRLALTSDFVGEGKACSIL